MKDVVQEFQDQLDRFAALKASSPGIRIRDAARKLGISEAELLQSQSLTGSVRRLRREDRGFGALLEGLCDVGEVMCLTRNDSAVHERYGVFGNCSLSKTMGLVLNRSIDLRIFMHRWAYGFVEEQVTSEGRSRVALQFFDKHGVAVHKIYTTPETDRVAFDALVAKWATPERTPIDVTAAPQPKADLPDAKINAEKLRADWAAMTDPHQFIFLLKNHSVGRMQSLRLAGPSWATEVPQNSVTGALEIAAASGVSVMIFVGSEGCIQIHTDPIQTVKPMGPWINVLDAKFNLHLRSDHVAHVWIVKRPADTGFVHSIEAYDHEKRLIFQMFGERKEGLQELEGWRALLDQIERRIPDEAHA